MCAFTALIIELDGRADLLSGRAGVDDTGKAGGLRRHVLGHRCVLWDSGILAATAP